MNLAQFQTAAERTMTGPGAATSQEERLINAALGLCGEAAEVAEAFRTPSDAHLLEECGDFLWYAAQHSKACGWTLGQFEPHREDDPIIWIWYTTGKLADMAKKQVFHQKDVSAVDRWRLMDVAISSIATILDLRGYTLSDACEHNVAKLLKRFPVHFTPEAANARADERVSSPAPSSAPTVAEETRMGTCARCGTALNNVSPGYSIVAGGATVCMPCLGRAKRSREQRGLNE